MLSSFLHSGPREDGSPLVDSVVVTVAPMFIGEGISVVPTVSFEDSLVDSRAMTLACQSSNTITQRQWERTLSWSAALLDKRMTFVTMHNLLHRPYDAYAECFSFSRALLHLLSDVPVELVGPFLLLEREENLLDVLGSVS